MKIKYIILSLLVSIGSLAQAQDFKGLKEGVDYLKSPEKESIVESNKPVVAEVFWYGCGHCFSMLPKSKALFKKYNNKIVEVPYPAAFDNWKSGAQIYFTLEQMGVANDMHEKVFNEIHVKQVNILKKAKERDNFLQVNKIDVNKFNSIYDSFSVNTKITKAKKIITDLNIQSTPSYVIFYKKNTYQVSPSLVGGYDRTIQVMDELLAQMTK